MKKLLNKKGFILILAAFIVIGAVLLAGIWYLNNYEWNKAQDTQQQNMNRQNN